MKYQCLIDIKLNKSQKTWRVECGSNRLGFEIISCLYLIPYKEDRDRHHFWKYFQEYFWIFSSWMKLYLCLERPWKTDRQDQRRLKKLIFTIWILIVMYLTFITWQFIIGEKLLSVLVLIFAFHWLFLLFTFLLSFQFFLMQILLPWRHGLHLFLIRLFVSSIVGNPRKLHIFRVVLRLFYFLLQVIEKRFVFGHDRFLAFVDFFWIKEAQLCETTTNSGSKAKENIQTTLPSSSSLSQPIRLPRSSSPSLSDELARYAFMSSSSQSSLSKAFRSVAIRSWSGSSQVKFTLPCFNAVVVKN